VLEEKKKKETKLETELRHPFKQECTNLMSSGSRFSSQQQGEIAFFCSRIPFFFQLEESYPTDASVMP
jgi:hypothetical protein